MRLPIWNIMEKYISKLTNQDLGMFRVAACVPAVRPADIPGNVESIRQMVLDANAKGVNCVLFPELSVTGYTCADLFNDQLLLEESNRALDDLATFSTSVDCVFVVGAPIARNGRLYNCAVVIGNGEIIGYVPKSYIPNYNEFYEKRWFASGFGIDSGDFSTRLIFKAGIANVGIEICEDLWVPEPPSGKLAMAGADVILNLSASDALIGKRAYAMDLIANQSGRCRCAYVYASAGFGESSTDLAFAGNAIIAENGTILRSSPEFTMHPIMEIADIDIQHLRHDRMHFGSFTDHFNGLDDYRFIQVTKPAVEGLCDRNIQTEYGPMAFRHIDPTPFVDKDQSRMNRRCDEISSIQAWGLATRLKAINCKHVVVGISGGLDSTLALLVTAKAFDMLGLDRKGIYGITMPGFGTTDRTKNNADMLMETLGVTSLEIPIGAAVDMHFKDIDHDPAIHDITYENSQARQRTLILMDYANKVNGLVIGTGDLSELALGWCTYNGDQMSMYGVNASVPKTMVRYLVSGYARKTDNPELKRILDDVVNTPISPELLPPSKTGEILQKTEDKVGPYELHDFFLYHLMRFGSEPGKIAALAIKSFDGTYDRETIYKWLKTFYRRFFTQQFKRSCMPDGVKVGSICLSPRGDWRMPSDASVRIWLDRIAEIEY